MNEEAKEPIPFPTIKPPEVQKEQPHVLTSETVAPFNATTEQIAKCKRVMLSGVADLMGTFPCSVRFLMVKVGNDIFPRCIRLMVTFFLNDSDWAKVQERIVEKQ